jgi:hypothetical protein
MPQSCLPKGPAAGAAPTCRYLRFWLQCRGTGTVLRHACTAHTRSSTEHFTAMHAPRRSQQTAQHASQRPRCRPPVLPSRSAPPPASWPSVFLPAFTPAMPAAALQR